MMKDNGMKAQEQLLDIFGEFIYVAVLETYDVLFMNERSVNILGLTSDTYIH